MNYISKTQNTSYHITGQDGWSIDGVHYTFEVHPGSKDVILMKDAEGKTYEAIIQEIDQDKKKVKVLLQQKELVIEILDPIDQKMLALGIDTKKLQKAKNIKAPMPGLILKTLVSEGETVKEGHPLFVLEAMKMENVFKAPEDVEIKNILIKEGETVDKNQELIIFN